MAKNRIKVIESISAMDDKELAELLVCAGCETCPLRGKCDDSEYDEMECEEALEVWLGKETK